MFDVLKLGAKIGMDSSEFNKGLDDASSKFSGFGKLISGGASKLGSIAVGAFKATSAAIGASVAGIAALTKASFDAYADYEQLTGGVETLFGNSYKSIEEYAEAVGKDVSEVGHAWEQYEGRAETVMKNAENAYRTAGMTANEYMELVTSFAASLNSSLGENAYYSANYADMAITDMADNANKMGTSLESIQNAYVGFSKQNFQMLDNLKLGYGGTKTEMERLLRDAEELAGYEIGSLSVENFSDIVDAIHIVQTEMHISGISIEEYNDLIESGAYTQEEAFEMLGTTAKEATGTISGSFSMLKGSWQNLVAGFANPDADLSELIGNVVDSAKIMLNNAVPVISQALTGIGQAVAEFIPIIGEQLPTLINDLLPPLLEAAMSLVNTLVDNLPALMDVIVAQIPVVLPKLIEATTSLLSALADQLPTIISIISDVLVQELPKIISKLQANLGKITSGLSAILKSIGNMLVQLFPVVFPMLVKIGLELVKTLANYIKDNASQMVSSIIEIMNVIIDTLLDPFVLMQLIESAITIIMSIANALIDNLDTIVDAVLKVIGFVIVAIVGEAPNIIKAALELFNNIGNGIEQALEHILYCLGEVLTKVLGLDGLGSWVDDVLDAGQKAFEAIGDGITAAWETIKKGVTEFGEKIWNGIKEGVGDLWEKGKEMVMKIVEGIKDSYHYITDALTGKGISSKMQEKYEELGLTGANAYVEGQAEGFDINSPSKKMAYIGEMVMAGFAKGVDDESDHSFDEIENTFSKFSPEITMSTVGAGGNGKIGFGTESESLSEKLDLLLSEGLHFTLPVFIGNKQVDELYVDSKQRVATRSGGQVDV